MSSRLLFNPGGNYFYLSNGATGLFLHAASKLSRNVLERMSCRTTVLGSINRLASLRRGRL